MDAAPVGKSSRKRKRKCGALQQWSLSSNLHGSGAHVGEDFFSGSGVLIITQSSIETLLHVWNRRKEV